MKYDFLFVFNFDESTIEDALQRFRCSIGSIKDQDVRICISNNSKKDIYDDIKGLLKEDSKYLHKEYTGPFSRALGINFGVKQLVESDYFMVSDIDLVYQEDHIENIKLILDEHKEDEQPIRLINLNWNIKDKCYTSNYHELVGKSKSPVGLAHGNGVICLESFYKVCGYSEKFHGYGPEDSEFNKRLERINNVIYSENNKIITAHIYHPRLQMIQFTKNHQIYNDKLNELKNNKDLSVCIANKEKEDWGVI